MSDLAEFLAEVYLPARTLCAGWIGHLQVAVRLFQAWNGPTRISDLSDDLVSRFVVHRCRQVSAVTANNNRRAILALWRCAWRKRLHAELPRDVPKAPATTDEPEAWLLEEIERLLDVAQRWPGNCNGSLAGQFWPALILTLYDTGLRIGAALQIRTVDVDLERRAVLARGRSQKNRTGQWLRISEQTARAVAAIYRPAYKLLFNWPYTQQYLTRRFRKLIDAAGLAQPAKPFHKFRKSCASYTLAAGGNPTIQLGHSSPSVTRVYLDPRIVQRQQAADILPRPKF